jgi:polar amino acid transport system substrate-binding protein
VTGPTRRWCVALAGAAVLLLGACSSGDPGGAGDGAPAGGDAAAEPSSAVPTVPEQLDTVQAGSLTACVDVPNVPYAFEEAGQVAGVSADLVRALGGRLARPAAFVDVEPGDLLGALQEGRCDLVASSLVAGTGLPDGLVFSDPYLTVEQSLLVRGTDQDRYRDLASLRGRRIGVLPATAGAELARSSAPDATVVSFDAPGPLFAALDGGEIDGVVADYPVNAHQATTSGRSVVVATFPAAPTRALALVLPDDDSAFVAAVDGALGQVTADDTFPTVLRRYLGTAPQPG